MSQKTFVIGVGMTKFDKPGSKEGDYPDWAREAGTKALADAGIAYELVEQAFAATATATPPMGSAPSTGSASRAFPW